MEKNLNELRESYLNNINYNKDDIYNAKLYMIDYESLLDEAKMNIGIIGRVFGKIFGTSMYSDIEKILYYKYHLTYNKALNILFKTHNNNYIFDPFK